MDAICVLFPLSSQLKSSSVSVVFDFNASLNDVAPLYPIMLAVDFDMNEKNGLLVDAIFVLFLLDSLPRLSLVSVVFDFNASLNDITPLSPIPFPVDLMVIEKKKSGLFVDSFCVLFLLCLQLRLSEVSVVFDFNALLNDVTPVSPMLLSVDTKHNGGD